MSQTFANTIDGNDIYAKRAECDAAGNTLSTTYATKSELPDGVPAVTSSDNNKVLKASYSGGVASYSWQTESGGGGGGGDGADWAAEQGEPGYIENKPVPKTLTGGTGISITESSSTITVSCNVTAPVQDVTVDGTSVVSNGVAAITMPTPPTVDQTYSAASTNAQSGTAVADAIGNLPTNLSSAQLLALKQALGVDETVLYESANGMQLKNGLQLPETLYNFDRILFYLDSTQNGAGTPAAAIVPIQAPPYPNGTITLYFSNGHDMTSEYKISWKWKMRLSGTTLTLTEAKYWGQHNTEWTQGDNPNDATVFKIVGVHRIASN